MKRLVRFLHLPCIVLICLSLAYAESGGDVPGITSSVAASNQPSGSWLDVLWSLPLLRLFAPLFEVNVAPPEASIASDAPVFKPPAAMNLAADERTPVGACRVAPLDAIEDPAAQQLEANVDSGAVVDVSDMEPAAARALGRFQFSVAAVGGTMVLKSAYRPVAYQRHLQNVWYKWMDELRDNHDPACQELRAQVGYEFARHRLLETQHPVAISDHTRGLAFDATVDLPSARPTSRFRLTLDGLARRAGLIRPAIAADPVHFKYVGVAVVHSRSRHARSA